MFYQLDKYRNNKGYIVLDNVKKSVLERATYGSRKKIWFLINNQAYIFKENNGLLEDIKEMINQLLSDRLQISSIESDLAVYNGKKGTITKDFSDGLEFKPMLSYLCEINDVHNNIYTYISFLLHVNLKEEEINRNIKIWLENHLLDIFTCQRDRTYKNIALFRTDFLPVPRYDSSGSFLSISKYEKVYNFVKSSSKEEMFEKYGGTRTKLRIFPGPTSENSIYELLKAQYVTYDNTYITRLLKQELTETKQFLLKLSQIDFDDIYYQLQESNIKLNQIYRDCFKMIFDYKLQEYFTKEAKIKTLSL